MAASAGKLFLIKKNMGTTGSPVWTSIGGLQTKSLKVNNQAVEITSDDSTNIEYLAGAGITDYTVTGEGVSKDGAVDKALVQAATDRTDDEYQVIWPGIGTFEGTFMVETLDGSGTTKAETRMSFTLRATGTITFTAE